MSYIQETTIKLLIENILAEEYKNFTYSMFLTHDMLQIKSGTFDKNWEAKTSFLIDPNKLTLPNNIQISYSISYKLQGSNRIITSAILPLSSLIEVKLQNTRETIKGNWLTKDKTVPKFIKEQVITRKCQHIDGAILIAQYIVNEIKQNINSTTAKLIKSNLENASSLTASGSEVPAALGLWWNAVRTGSKWDHKPKIRDNPEFKKVAVHRPLERGVPSLSYYHKYKDHDYFYDVWSNIHYGYVGLCVGFDKGTLGWGASKEQSNAGGGSVDPIDDVTAVNIGYQLYARFGETAHGLTAQHILDALEKCTDAQFPESRKTHWCWNNQNPLKIERK